MEQTEHQNHEAPAAPANKASNRKGYIALFNIFLAIVVASQVRVWYAGPFNTYIFMQTFMGLFFLVFGSFKAVNWKIFARSYGDYDLVARRLKAYAYAYPAIELGLGTAFLFNYHPVTVNALTLILVTVGAVGIAKNILAKNQVQCLCLGAVIKLSLSKISLFEDVLMGAMALTTLLRLT